MLENEKELENSHQIVSKKQKEKQKKLTAEQKRKNNKLMSGLNFSHHSLNNA